MATDTLINYGAFSGDPSADTPREGGMKLSAPYSATYVCSQLQFGGATAEAIITNTISAAATDGVPFVLVPNTDQTAVPPITLSTYDPSLVTTNPAVVLFREDRGFEHDPGAADPGGAQAYSRIGSESNREMGFWCYVGALGEPTLRFGRAQGTWVSKLVPNSGDICGEWSARAWDGANWQRIGHNNFTADGAQSLHSTPGKWVVAVTPTGSTSPVSVWTIRANNGDLQAIVDDSPFIGGSANRPNTIFAGTGGFVSSRIAGSASYRARSAQGTIGTPTHSVNGDQLGAYILTGYTGSGYLDTAYIKGVAAEDFGVANGGTKLVFATTLKTAITPSDRWSMIDTGDYVPVADNATDVGSSSNRLRSLYYATSVKTSAGVQILGTRRTGWTAWTGTAVRTTQNADAPPSATQIAQALKALIDDLIAHGLIGP